jgi:hypothetical protein
LREVNSFANRKICYIQKAFFLHILKMDDDKLTQCPFPHKFSLSKEKVQEINGQNNKKKPMSWKRSGLICMKIIYLDSTNCCYQILV